MVGSISENIYIYINSMFNRLNWLKYLKYVKYPEKLLVKTFKTYEYCYG